MKKLYLNLGSGNVPIEEAINVDLVPGKYVDETTDLKAIPWKWEDESVDGIYMINFLEHLPDTIAVLRECCRILKKGGFLHIHVPHASNITSLGTIEHYHSFSYLALSRTLCSPNIHWGKQLFKTVIPEKVFWLGVPRSKNPYVKFKIKQKETFFVSMARMTIEPIIQFFINLSPKMFDNLWCYWVGGANEIVWRGIKI